MEHSLTEPQRKKMAQRLMAALDLMEFGVLLMRQNIRRKLPNASSAIIDAELHRWLIEQPTNFVAQDFSNSSQA